MSEHKPTIEEIIHLIKSMGFREVTEEDKKTEWYKVACKKPSCFKSKREARKQPEGKPIKFMRYKGYTGTVYYSDDKVFFGHIDAIDPLELYRGVTLPACKEAFHEYVDDYLAYCKKSGREPIKP